MYTLYVGVSQYRQQMSLNKHLFFSGGPPKTRGKESNGCLLVSPYLPAPLWNHGKPLFGGIYRGNIIPGFLGGAGFRPSTV